MSRVYRVNELRGVMPGYVRAETISGAIRAVARSMFTVKPCTVDEVYRAMKDEQIILDAVDGEGEGNGA